MKTHGIMFHHFHDDKLHIRGQGSISAETFSTLLDALRGWGLTILNAPDYYDRALCGALEENEICITFDDALRCQYDIARPVLDARGIQAFFFVYSSPLIGNVEKLEVYRHFRFSKFADVDEFYAAFFETAIAREPTDRKDVKNKLAAFDPAQYLTAFGFYTDNDRRFRYLRDDVYGPKLYNEIMDAMLVVYGYDVEANRPLLWMTPDNLRDMRAHGHVIGLHSHTHPTVLGSWEAAAQENEYTQNSRIVASILGETPTTVSYPSNSYSPETLAILAGLGVHLGFRANMLDGYDSMLELPREDHANILRRMREEGIAFE